ncbi:MAG: hypothetical protein J6A48_02225, partial [Clostridia bacterium]|nr:hypothetical protein [Clostridia bacterium]
GLLMRDTLTFHARHASHQPAFLWGRCESALVSINALHMWFTRIKYACFARFVNRNLPEKQCKNILHWVLFQC